MGVKSVLALAFVLAVVAAANIPPNDVAFAEVYKNNIDIDTANSRQSNHLILGSRIPGDRLAVQQSVVKSSSWMQVTTREQTFSTSGYGLITQIQALDQKTNGNGARAIVTAGGPGQNYVTLRFKSQRGHGINFLVQIYAR
ncbi:probable salivary secreted peptide [Cephus cinctus]|uniref:Probable salivary secreted peptide n=1 Tax=Cephus cinctus TaxID=211228 RepID=A0AAJ7BPN0_CEPCN|nr:probable salivary secreted peptide [Cephus cinctus]